MKRLWIILVAGLLLAALTAPALAWEFSMTGEFELRYRYIARTGPRDLFGNADLAQRLGTAIGTTIGLSGPVVTYLPFGVFSNTPSDSGTSFRLTNAVQVEGYSVMGSDAAFFEQRAEFYPEFRVNQAIRLRGTIALQGNPNGPYVTGSRNWTDNPFYTPWITLESRGVNGQGAFAVPVFRHFWATVQSPLGILVAGTRPAPFGLGWSTFDQQFNTHSLTLVAPYGPMNLFLGIYKGPGVKFTDPGSVAGPDSAVTDPFNGHQLVAQFTDQNLTRNINFYAAFTYGNGPLETGSLWRQFNHQGTHGSAWAPGTRHSFRNDQSLDVTRHVDGGFFLNNSNLGPIYTGNEWVALWINYIKYNNGRFFFNAEFDQQWIEIFRNGGRPISGTPYAWMVELGAFCGPAKVTLAHFLKTGHDRRGGTFFPTSAIGFIPAVNAVYNDKWEEFVNFAGCDQSVKPYNYLIGLYGTGNNGYNDYGFPNYADFVAYAGRVDYAVAANLNLWGSYMYALRQSNTGTRVGQFNGFSGTTFSGIGPHFGTSQFVPTPNVPDDYLGWETDVGVDWKLLEGLTFKFLFAYWQPGPWFKWAYIDQSALVPFPIGGTTVFINPSRGIDPLIAFQSSVLVEF